MPRKVSPLLPSSEALLRQLGDRLRLVRRRRHLPAKQVAERAGMTPMTLRSLERGGTGVTIGAYLAVMQVLGIERDLDLLAQTDSTGHALQDARLSPRGKTTAPAKPSTVPNPMQRTSEQMREMVDASAEAMENLRKPVQDPQDWIEKSGFASSRALGTLIDPEAPLSKTKTR